MLNLRKTMKKFGDFKAKYVDLENENFTLNNRDEEIARLKTELNNINSMKEFCFACEKCAHKFEAEIELFANMKSAHSDCVICDECKFTAENIGELKTHQEILHGKYFQQCKHTFAGEKKLNKHVCRIQISNPCS